MCLLPNSTSVITNGNNTLEILKKMENKINCLHFVIV